MLVGMHDQRAVRVVIVQAFAQGVSSATTFGDQ